MGKTLFFNLFFDELNKTDINYCIMNGYEDYPEKIRSDIDIIVNSYSEFESFLKVLSKKLNFQIVQKLQHKYKVANFFIYKDGALLSLDIYEHYIVNNRLLFDNKFFLKDKIKYKNFYIPNKEKEFLYYFVKKIIKQDIDTNTDKLFEQYQKDVNLKKYFKNSYKDIHQAFENKNKIYFQEKKLLLKKELFNTVKPNLFLTYQEIIRIIKRLFNPTGFTISLLGPDGSGKSTIINELRKRELPFRRVDYFHLKPRIIGSKGDAKPVPNPHAKKPYKGILSYLKLFHFMSDYIVGYFVKILPLKIKSSLIIFDRYYDDILIDPKRFRYGGSIKFAKIMRYFIPRPDIYFILVADAKVLYKRKQEVSFDELKRQLNEYQKLADGKKYILIDVDRDVKEIVDEVEKLYIAIL